MDLTIEPLDAPLGAEVSGLTFGEPVDGATREMLVAAVDEHLALLFRNDEPPSNQAIVDFCECFGTLRPTLADKSRLPGYPGINRVSNVDADGVVGTGGHDVVAWHSDLSFNPPLIERLWLDALALPPSGGETKWINLVAAYDALPAAMRDRIDDLVVEYRLRDGLDFTDYFKASDPDALADRTRISLVQTNPRTGRRSVWPNTGPDFAAQIVGYDADASAALLAELYAHCTDERFQYSHDWRVGDGALWLNTQTMHQREAFPADAERVLRHVNILGVADPAQLVA